MERVSTRTATNRVLLSLKDQDKRKKDVKEGGQYTVPVGPKCFGCQDFGHMKQECPTSLKSIGKSKAFATTLSDTKLKDIVNSAFILEKTIPEPKIVRKVLRFLPQRFHA